MLGTENDISNGETVFIVILDPSGKVRVKATYFVTVASPVSRVRRL